jgi:hypothetical protein
MIVKLKHVAFLLSLIVFSLSFISCGDEKEDEPDDPSEKTFKELLVGTWRYNGTSGSDTYITILTLKNDGTGTETESWFYEDGSKKDPYNTWYLDWIYDDETKYLTLVYTGDSDCAEYENSSIETVSYYVPNIDEEKFAAYIVDTKTVMV